MRRPREARACGEHHPTVASSRPSTRSVPRRPPASVAAVGGPERLLTAVVLALVCFGLVMVFSTSSATALLNDGDPLGLVIRQARLRARRARRLPRVRRACSPRAMRRLGPPALAVSGFLLLVVLVPSIGTPVNGSRRWISLGGLGQLQPSELAKLALALWIAQAVVRRARGACARPAGLAPLLAVTGVLGLLILIEPDMGTAVSLCAVAFAMLIVAGARMRHLGRAGRRLPRPGDDRDAGRALPARALLHVPRPLGRPQRRRASRACRPRWRSAPGGLHGVGLGDGVQKAFYLPEAHTDMILATVGEELGLIGVLAVLVGFAPVRPRRLPHRASARGTCTSRCWPPGLTTLVVMQAAINIGAVVGVLPVTGVPLPFVSFGGSSLIVLLAVSGLLVNIGRRSHAAVPSPLAVPAREGDDRGRGDGRPRDAGAGGRRRAAGAGG